MSHAPTAAKRPATHKSATCPICQSKVVVWKKRSLKASLLRALALADHVRVLHPQAAR